MAIRPPDHDFTDDLLWRGLRHPRADGTVSPGDINLPACSCDRRRYQDSPATTLHREAQFLAVAALDPNQLPTGVPGRMVRHVVNGRATDRPECWYEFRAFDRPLVDNAAHCEVTVCRDGAALGAESAIPAGARERLKKELALRMAVCLRADGSATPPPR